MKLIIPQIAKSGNKSHTIFTKKCRFSSNTVERRKWFKLISKELDLFESQDSGDSFFTFGKIPVGRKMYSINVKDVTIKMRVKITSYRIFPLDTINLYQAHKPVEDALQQFKTVITKDDKKRIYFGVGLIKDDKPEWCALTCEQVHVHHRNEVKTVIEIEPY